ncbi:FAD-dependent oxidoreductase [Bradyrhizobium sp. Ash2021]|uniref:FAD-dependent oxidoreductase n=1 Tax=Bradyrhizobium sp. Ash2021 TaxID=2954771 RepID=UPI002815014F|nr:FAD-dependent oxidoreductase [Bradyrhizobium sp. Ash2021]WMT73186.1 FAD-dependent oxidoreductase [Bradyrhizobium sp. Ash2021]
MYQSSKPGGDSPVSIIGAGIAGAWQALLFAQASHAVTLHERSDAGMTESTSHWAGGMLAPWCEAETSEPLITRLGVRSLTLWREQFPQTPFNGSLVVAHARDRADFERFAKLTTGHKRLDARGLSELEPSLEGRFRDGLFYAGEGHVEPRLVLPELHARIAAAGGRIEFNSDADAKDLDGIVIDCRGLAARDTQPELRGVKGEMIIVETSEVELSRPVRLIHPRWPLYVIPRGDGRFMLGATSIEAEDSGVSVRSALELLGAAYAVHPAFAEARIVEFGSGLRPAFPDHLPRIAIDNDRIAVNGLYRHGFLLAPALAELTLGYVARGVIDNEVMQCA